MARSKITDRQRKQGADLGQALQTARTDKRKSQSQVASDAGLPVDTLRRIEQGQVANPGVFTVAAIADALGRSVSHFVKRPERRRR